MTTKKNKRKGFGVVVPFYQIEKIWALDFPAKEGRKRMNSFNAAGLRYYECKGNKEAEISNRTCS